LENYAGIIIFFRFEHFYFAVSFYTMIWKKILAALLRGSFILGSLPIDVFRRIY